MNHLQHEKSPYLLQHAENLVDWYPWGKEAFKKAERENKPVFLSIGYSTCHWCHVMAHESFESQEVAEILNRDFISVKVDREERPDIDAVYMNICQAVNGSGGWPLTAVLSPDQKPFFVGTYFPRHSRYGHPGLVELLQEISSLWKNAKEELVAAGSQLTDSLREAVSSKNHIPERELLQKAAELFRQNYDPRYGGFGRAPKFPVPHNLFFLMRYADEEKDPQALSMVEHTLQAMAAGGIFDHIGGGFSRYSTDEKWLVPHFEKMLYDNALLAIAYLEAYQITKKKHYAEAAGQTLDYMLKELCGPEGEFYCGQDADSEGVEGKYYCFVPEEVQAVLGNERGKEFCRWYDITEAGNFEGKSIPNRIAESPSFGQSKNTDQQERETFLPPSMKESRKILYEYRKKRVSLHLDDKVILSWNAWAILAMAKAGQVLKEEKYCKAAEWAQHFIFQRMTGENNRLFLRWRDGEAAHDGNLDDYAVYALSLLKLYEVTFEPAYLKEAIFRAEQILQFFEDDENGGFFLTAKDSEKLISRPKETYDGAIPSGNSVAAVLFGRLAAYTGEVSWQEASEKQNRFLSGVIGDFPYGYSFGLVALSEAVYPSKELVCVSADENVPVELQEYLANSPHFRVSVLLKTPQNAEALEAAVTYIKEYPIPEKGCCYYLCQYGACGKTDRLAEMFKENS